MRAIDLLPAEMKRPAIDRACHEDAVTSPSGASAAVMKSPAVALGQAACVRSRSHPGPPDPNGANEHSDPFPRISNALMISGRRVNDGLRAFIAQLSATLSFLACVIRDGLSPSSVEIA